MGCSWEIERQGFEDHGPCFALKELAKGLAQGNAKSPVPKVWPQNCNRFRNREQGPHIVYKRLGIIRKPKKSEKGVVYFIKAKGMVEIGLQELGVFKKSLVAV